VSAISSWAIVNREAVAFELYFLEKIAILSGLSNAACCA